jgi:DNA mismatch repair protein MutL
MAIRNSRPPGGFSSTHLTANIPPIRDCYTHGSMCTCIARVDGTTYRGSDPMTIHRLDTHTIGKIAAGEVVERPASVAKELIENSLDAGATQITVELSRGGRELIQITDNGSGIPADELEAALERHTTSKLQRFEDLTNLHSYGFRGEALSSIAAVSDFQITSRPPESEHGARIRVRHGNVGNVDPTASAPGTVVSVRDLFANVPARQKFLRKDSTEASYVQRTVTAAALAAPGVRFELIIDGKSVLSTDGSSDLGNTLVGILGADIAAQMVPIASTPEPDPDDPDRPNIEVEGYIGLPTITRGNRQQMFVTVNRRWIDHRPLNFAIEQAYHSLIMVGRFPIVVLDITIPPERLDVNVHPTKREVRFSDERLVFKVLQRAVRETLLLYTADQDIPHVTHSPMSHETAQRRMTLANPDRASRPRHFDPAEHLRPPESDYQSASSTSQSTGTPAETEPLPPHERPAQSEPTSEMPVLRVLGQVGGNYIIAEGPDGMYLIDQHAAHERVLYEKLLNQFHSGNLDQQRLLDAIVVELTPEQLSTLEQCHDDLSGLGFEIEDFGSGSVAVRAIPAIMRGRNITENLQLILEEIASGGRGDSVFDSLVISAACHSSIRAGQTLTLPEMRELIVQLERCSSPRACGHGRPTMLLMSQEDLARQFERR